jgi:hypothetical protein
MKKMFSVLLALAMAALLPLMASAVDSIELPEPPPEIVEIIEEYQPEYGVIIHYIYYDGTEAAPDFTQIVSIETELDVPSPVIEGYTPTMYSVEIWHPEHFMEFTVIYSPGYASIEDYETPLGIGGAMMNVGVCIE